MSIANALSGVAAETVELEPTRNARISNVSAAIALADAHAFATNCSNVRVLNATRSADERVASSAVGFLTVAEDGAVTLVNITVPAAAFNGSTTGSGAFGTLAGASVTLPGRSTTSRLSRVSRGSRGTSRLRS